MVQAQSPKQPPIIPFHRKPFSDLTNRRHATSFSQSKKRTPSTIAAISDSSTRSTQNLNRLTPKTPTPDDWVGDRNRIARSRRNTVLKTRSKRNTAATVPVYPVLLEKTENETKKSKNIMEEDVCTPLSGTKIHDNRKPTVDGEEKALQSNLSSEPLPNNKRRKCSLTESSGNYVVPQDFIDQQRAYYEEIDGYELEVEVECQSVDDE